MKKLLLFIFTVASLSAFAEGNTVEVRLGIDSPGKSKMKFNDSEIETGKEKILKSGFELGAEYRKDLGTGFEVGGGVFYKRNGFKKSSSLVGDPLTDTLPDGTDKPISLNSTFKGLDSFPVYATARYNFYTGNDDIKPYIKANLGYSLNSGSFEAVYAENGTVFYTDVQGKLEEKYKFKNGLYYGIGGGLKYKQYSVDLSYNVIESKFDNTYLSHAYSSSSGASSYEYTTDKGKLRNQFVTLSVGYNFGF